MLLTLGASLLAAQLAAAPRRPFPQHTVYAAGTIRPNHRTQVRQDDDVRAYYEVWKKNYLVAATPGYRVTMGMRQPHRTTSESQGYGMVIVALMAGHDPEAQTLFDGLWTFARTYRSRFDSRLMSWQIPVDPEVDANAFDGDADIAFALLLADAQFGSGAIDYKAEARRVVAGILESTIGPQSRLPTLGDWIDPNGATHNQYTPRSSDFMPGHFRAYAQATGDPVWLEVVAACQRLITSLQTNYSSETGLLPDFIVNGAPAPPNFLEDDADGAYFYNAGRDPWRIGTDAMISGDATSMAQAKKISQWARAATGGVPSQFRAGYRLDGTPLPDSDYFSIFFVAPLGVAAMTDRSQQQWLNDVYDAVFATHEDYYEDSVTLLSLLTMTGNMWSPESERRSRRRSVRH
jgi:endo-1,4-beta-D-glucanase Y